MSARYSMVNKYSVASSQILVDEVNSECDNSDYSISYHLAIYRTIHDDRCYAYGRPCAYVTKFYVDTQRLCIRPA